MIISQSQIQLAAQHSYQEKTEVRERIRVLDVQELDPPPVVQPQPAPSFTSTGIRVSTTQKQSLSLSAAVGANDRLQMLIIAQRSKQITGRELRLLTPEQVNAPAVAQVELPASQATPAPVLVYERQTRYEETEKMQFAARGKVMTQDGREIDISASLRMSRSFVATSSLTVGGNAVMTDPLVINFDGTGAQLESTRFDFDLDSDGIPEQIASLAPNSGYLALDRNGDGQINNGSELFGPTSNNGFAELAAYDEDGNGFIDEGDSIYSQLRIWQRHSDGSSSLIALGDKNIGAIYLGHALSPMQLKDSANNSLGEVVSSGFYLREDGSTGLIQQINLAV
jgi:hypothetical protein